MTTWNQLSFQFSSHILSIIFTAKGRPIISPFYIKGTISSRCIRSRLIWHYTRHIGGKLNKNWKGQDNKNSWDHKELYINVVHLSGDGYQTYATLARSLRSGFHFSMDPVQYFKEQERQQSPDYLMRASDWRLVFTEPYNFLVGWVGWNNQFCSSVCLYTS